MDRGSEWRKWDLHIHTPGTAKSDQFGNSDDVWEQYIEALEKTDIAVFGITDYFSIDNYYRVKEYQEAGRLQGKVILPNVEMRITPVTKSGTAINIHAIFDPTLTKQELEREFFGCLTMKSGDETYGCTREHLVAFGRKLANDSNYSEVLAIKKAIGEFVISFEQLHEVLGKHFFDNRVIVALSGKSNDGLSGLLNTDCNSHTLRQQIGRMADVILSSNVKDIAYFIGEGVDNKDRVVDTYRSLKPCVIGSDAHRMDAVGVFPNDRITWIKADPSFEGLKQILFEPKERVRISENMPDSKFDYDIIDRVVLNTAGVWNQEILFNQNLNTIIGGRSTGKSTLLACIATKTLGAATSGNKDFINRLSENVRVIWRDGQESPSKEIEYFTQNEIANLIDRNDSDKLFRDILIGDPSKRDAFDKFKADEAARFSSIQSKVTLFFEKRRQYSDKYSQLKSLGDKEGINREIDKLEKQLAAIQQKLTDKKEVLEAYQAIEKELSGLQRQNQTQQAEIKTLHKLQEADFLVQNPLMSFLGLTPNSASLVSREVKNTLFQANSHLHEFVETLLNAAEENNRTLIKQIVDKQNDSSYKEGKLIFQENNNLSNLTKQIAFLSAKREVVNMETANLEQIKAEYHAIASDLLKEHLSYLELMNSIASEFRVKHDNITLSANYELKPELEKTLNETFSLRSVMMNQLITDTVNQYKKKTKEDIKRGVTELLNKALKGELAFKNGYNVQSFLTILLSTNWFKLKYNVDYEGDNLLDMSPGKRSFVILKLLLDFSDKKCPILIDQPEDNLDNRAIYNELVKYIREKKKERQIILVTHNPNIVVGADSEEVIVANQNGKNAPNSGGIKFQYVTGSLENSSERKEESNIPILDRCGIREHVCDILEGGENAFRDRENKYGFFKI